MDILKITKEALVGKHDGITEPDAERPVGRRYSDDKLVGTILPYAEKSEGVIGDGVKFPDKANVRLPTFGADGENLTKRIFNHPVTGKKMIAEGTGVELIGDIVAAQSAHTVHFSKGMSFVNRALAPYTRQVTNSTGQMTSNNAILWMINWLKLSWVGGPVAKLSNVLKLPGFGGHRLESTGPTNSTNIGPQKPPISGD